MVNIVSNDVNINYSKGNWLLGSDSATCYNGGANFCFVTDAFTKGNRTITLNFETPNTDDGYRPVLAWRIDGLLWGYAKVRDSVTITLPSTSNDCNTNPLLMNLANHHVEVWIRNITTMKPRWSWNGNVNNSICIFKSLDMPDGSTLLATTLNKITMFSQGASFTEGYGALGTEGGGIMTNDTTCSWGVLLGRALGFNVATSGYAGSGFSKGGEGDSPPITFSYKYMDADIPRDYTGIDIAAFNIGANDGNVSSKDFLNYCDSLIEYLQERYPNMTLLFTVPFWGMHQNDYAVLGQKYKDDPKVLCVDTVYPFLKNHHPTITDYTRLIMPDLVEKVKSVLLRDYNMDIVKQVQVVKQNNIIIDNSNSYQYYKLR